MSLKIEFVQQATEPGANLAALCRKFGISRPTGYKWLLRYKQSGFAGLEEESRRPKSSPLAFTEEMIAVVLELRDKHPSWGAKKLVPLLRRRFGSEAPTQATVARILKRFGRIRETRKRRPIHVVDRAPVTVVTEPNELWTVDFKGWWNTHDGDRCNPLTVRDAFSKFVLAVKLTRSATTEVRAVFEQLFRKFGVPKAIQSDNGTPFVSVRAPGGLSRLSAWWVSLGIELVRGRPGCPQDNGAHERMHRDISAEVERFPSATVDEQQRELDRWQQEFNHVRPHEALDGKSPAEVYRRSTRRPTTVPPQYPKSMRVRLVFSDGMIGIDGEKYYVSSSLAGHHVGIESIDPIRRRVWFYSVPCGEIEVLPGDVVDRVIAARLDRTDDATRTTSPKSSELTRQFTEKRRRSGVQLDA